MQRVITPTRGLPNPIKQVVPGISHILSYSISFSSSSPVSLFLVHNSTIIAEHKVKSYLSISPCHDHELTPSKAYTEHCIQRVLHYPKIVCLPFILTSAS